MKQTPPPVPNADTLLETIDPESIADCEVRQSICILLNLIEQLKSEVKALTEENQRLRDENNRLIRRAGETRYKAQSE